MKSISLLALATVISAQAGVTISLPGNSTTADWSGLTNATYVPPTYPTFGNLEDLWGTPIPANLGSDGLAALDKLAGGGYPSADSIYSFFTPGTFAVIQDSPVAALQTLVWQIDHTQPFSAAPILNYNRGSQALAADFTSSSNGAESGIGPIGPFQSVLAAYQWDLSGVAEPITDYQIVWTGGVHQSIYTMQLDESDSFAQVVPEPSVALLSLAGLPLVFRRRR